MISAWLSAHQFLQFDHSLLEEFLALLRLFNFLAAFQEMVVAVENELLVVLQPVVQLPAPGFQVEQALVEIGDLPDQGRLAVQELDDLAALQVKLILEGQVLFFQQGFQVIVPGVLDFAVAAGEMHLVFQFAQAVALFLQNQVQAVQVLLGDDQLAGGLFFPFQVLGDARRFFDQDAPFAGLQVDHFFDAALLENKVIAFADAQVEQRVLDVLVAAELFVEDVFPFAAAEEAPGDVGFIFVVGEVGADLGHAQGFFRGAAGKNEVLVVFAAQVLDALLAQDPEQGVDQVALAAAVGADHGRDALVELDDGFFRERFKAVQFEFFQIDAHDSVRAGLAGRYQDTTSRVRL